MKRTLQTFTAFAIAAVLLMAAGSVVAIQEAYPTPPAVDRPAAEAGPLLCEACPAECQDQLDQLAARVAELETDVADLTVRTDQQEVAIEDLEEAVDTLLLGWDFVDILAARVGNLEYCLRRTSNGCKIGPGQQSPLLED